MYTTRSKVICKCALALLLNAACRREQACPDCDAEPVLDLPPSDLPCGGANLQTDELNCGACEIECVAHAYEGTPYEVGECRDGECGPVWYEKEYDSIQWNGPPPPDVTCEEICGIYSTSCVAQGCSGKTGFVCSTTFGWGCSLTEEDGYPVDRFGACDEVVPWPEFDPGVVPQVGCCCRYQ